MFIPRIFRPSGISKPGARRRWSPTAQRFRLESLEDRTPLSGGLNIGFAESLISRADQFAVAEFGQSPLSNASLVKAIISTSPAVTATTAPFDGAIPDTLLGASLPLSPDSVEASASTVVEGLGAAPLFQASQLTAAVEFGTTSSGFGPYGRIENALTSLGSTALADGALVIDLGGNFSTVSHDDQYTGPAPSPVPAFTGPSELVGPNRVQALYDEGEPYFIAAPLPGSLIATLATARSQLAQADLNAISDPDISVLGSLTSLDLQGGTPALMTTDSNTGRGTGPGVGLISTMFTTQIDLSTVSGGNGWMSFVATGGSVDSGSPSSEFRGDVVAALGESADEPTTPASITAGDVPVSILLSGPDASAETDSGRLEQVAELIPLEESSLAMVATLWTVSSDSRTTPTEWDVEPAGAGLEPGPPLASPPSWTAFVIGLNEAFEQSQRDVEQAFVSSPRRTIEAAPGDLDGGLPWQGPILPASQQGSCDSTQPEGGNEAQSPHSSVSLADDAPSPSDGGSQVAVASIPTISAVSAFGLMAGWLWTQRQRWERVRSGKGARKVH